MAELYADLPQECEGSPTWTRQWNGATGRRAWYCEWEDCSKGWLPSWAPVPGQTKYDPDSDMYCTGVSIEPLASSITDGEGNTNYAVGILRADYSTLPLNEMKVRQTFSPGVINQEISGHRHWLSDNADMNDPLVVTMPVMRYARTFIVDWQVGYLDAITNLVGKINNGWYKGFAKDTCLFDAPDISTVWLPTTPPIEQATITYNITVRPLGWNIALRTDTGELDGIYPPLYQEGDFDAPIGMLW